MATNEIGEKIYYSDPLAKVTNVRITCNDISVPIGKIEKVHVSPRIEAYCFSVSIFIASLYSFLFYQTVPSSIRIVFAAVMASAAAASFAWVYQVCGNYIELELSIGKQRIAVLRSGMSKRSYVRRIAGLLEEAILDEKKYRKMKETGEIAESPALSLTETMRIKFILEDYASIKMKIREQYERKVKTQGAMA
ncbi:MAG TPA: hypothetical protein DCZ94_05270 [Lentisphaeria bacterium]|nr:MAG: hypothetical protein A2X48_12550 [Lentisphaerae bacterium GWF2_49_21]HBC86349.1 hypothetical protein [Lentisphaeria bacterium]